MIGAQVLPKLEFGDDTVLRPGVKKGTEATTYMRNIFKYQGAVRAHDRGAEGGGDARATGRARKELTQIQACCAAAEEPLTMILRYGRGRSVSAPASGRLPTPFLPR
jgi:hypothetical protein